MVFLSTEQAARHFNINSTTIRRYAKKNKAYFGFTFSIGKANVRQPLPRQNEEEEHEYCQVCGDEDGEMIKVCLECFRKMRSAEVI